MSRHTTGLGARAIVSLLLFCSPCLALQREDIAVITHPEVPEDDLSLGQIRSLLLGERQYWTPNLRVTLLIRAPVAREREVVLKKIYRMTEAQFRQYWIGKVFKAETVSGPKVVYSNDMASRLVGAIPGSITFVVASEVPDGVKVLKVDGSLPGQPDYRLR